MGFLMSVGSFPYRRQSLQIAPILSPNFILVKIQLIAVWLLGSPVRTVSYASSRKAGESMQPLTARRYCWYFSQTSTSYQFLIQQQYFSSPSCSVQTIWLPNCPVLIKSSLNSWTNLLSFVVANARPSLPSLQKGLSGTEQVKLSRFAGLGAARFLGVLKPEVVVQVGQRSKQQFSQSKLALLSLLYFRQLCSKVQDWSRSLRQSLTSLKSQWLSRCSTFLGSLVLLRVLRRSNCTPGPLILPLSFERELQRFLSQRMGSEDVPALLVVMLSLMTIMASRASRHS